MATIIRGKSIAPCIVAKARFALGITPNRPMNSKPCSVNYWHKVVKHIASVHKVQGARLQKALNNQQLHR